MEMLLVGAGLLSSSWLVSVWECWTVGMMECLISSIQVSACSLLLSSKAAVMADLFWAQRKRVLMVWLKIQRAEALLISFQFSSNTLDFSSSLLSWSNGAGSTLMSDSIPLSASRDRANSIVVLRASDGVMWVDPFSVSLLVSAGGRKMVFEDGNSSSLKSSIMSSEGSSEVWKVMIPLRSGIFGVNLVSKIFWGLVISTGEKLWFSPSIAKMELLSCLMW